MTKYTYPIHIMRVETTNPRLTWCGITKPSEQTEWENIDAAISPGDNKPEPCLACLVAIRAKLNDLIGSHVSNEEVSPEYHVTIHMVTHDMKDNSLTSRA